MKINILKRTMMTLLAAAGTVTMVCAAGERPETKVDQLPHKARTFIGEYFANRNVANVRREQWPTCYEVVFADGTKAEFDADGDWMEVNCRREAVPTVIVPQQIRDYVMARYPAQKIVSVSRDRRGYDVELSNGFELGFDRRFRLVDLDD